jgi:hypothetical protein
MDTAGITATTARGVAEGSPGIEWEIGASSSAAHRRPAGPAVGSGCLRWPSRS